MRSNLQGWAIHNPHHTSLGLGSHPLSHGSGLGSPLKGVAKVAPRHTFHAKTFHSTRTLIGAR